MQVSLPQRQAQLRFRQSAHLCQLPSVLPVLHLYSVSGGLEFRPTYY